MLKRISEECNSIKRYHSPCSPAIVTIPIRIILYIPSKNPKLGCIVNLKKAGTLSKIYRNQDKCLQIKFIGDKCV